MLRLLIDPSFQGVNRLFVLSYESIDHRTNYKRYILPTVEIKDYNIMIHRKNFFDKAIKKGLRTYDIIQKIATRLGDNYATGCLVDYPYFKSIKS